MTLDGYFITLPYKTQGIILDNKIFQSRGNYVIILIILNRQ